MEVLLIVVVVGTCGDFFVDSYSLHFSVALFRQVLLLHCSHQTHVCKARINVIVTAMTTLHALFVVDKRAWSPSRE